MSAPFRMIMMGSPDFAVPTLREILKDPTKFEVILVITQPDKKAGRGRKVLPCPMAKFGESKDLVVAKPKTLRNKDFQEELRQLNPDFIVVAAYGKILPQEVLSIPKFGCINVHASLLPQYRGASPVAHAILGGDSTTGVSIMGMTEGLDEGPIFATNTCKITDNHTRISLTQELAEIGANLLTDTLPAIANGTLQGIPQPEHGSSYARKIDKPDGLLDFSKSAVDLERQIRAFNPWPGTFTFLKNQRVRIHAATTSSTQHPERPGHVYAIDKAGISVTCGFGSLNITQIQPEGKKNMDASSWVAGRGIAVGNCFGMTADA
ncbi:MAG: methionyl-tRNA formyltransferase [Myxococcota bacterium]|nr:methionyl-tRNA formyltransferase [Myxococcota bacterium]